MCPVCVCMCGNDLIHILQAAAVEVESLSSLTSCSTIKTSQPAGTVLHSTAPITTLGKGRLIKNINCKPMVGREAHTASQNYTHVGNKRQKQRCMVFISLNHVNGFLNPPQRQPAEERDLPAFILHLLCMFLQDLPLTVHTADLDAFWLLKHPKITDGLL